MEIKILLLICMMFCHIINDYNLQGILASMKQKSWWEVNGNDPLYKHDYIMALFEHSFSWAFSIMIVPTLYLLHDGKFVIEEAVSVFLLFILNTVMHFWIDHTKANLHEINLIQDQLLHFLQIIIVWCLLIAL